MWTDEGLVVVVVVVVCAWRFDLLHVMHAGLEQQALLLQLVDLIRSRPPAFQLVLQHLFGLLKHPVVLLQLLEHRKKNSPMITRPLSFCHSLSCTALGVLEVLYPVLAV